MLRFSKPFDALKNGTWQGKEIREMVRSLGAVCALLLSSDVWGKTPSEQASDIEVMKTIRALVLFTLLSRQQAHLQISLKYLVEGLKCYYRCKVVFTPQRATAVRKGHLENDYSTEATETREEALTKFEASLQNQIYKATAAERQIFRAHLKKEQELARIWSVPDRALVEQQLDQSIFAATKMMRRQFEELYHDVQGRLDSQLRAGASHGPKSKFARELAQEYFAIKTTVYGRSRVTSAAVNPGLID